MTERLHQKDAERERVLGLFRRGRIDDATLDKQLDQVNKEAFGLHAEIESAARALSAGERATQLRSAEELLATLRDRLAGPIPVELKRRIVEILVEKIQANIVERFGVQQSEIVITYRFSRPNEPAALVLPRSHRLNTRSSIPEQLNTLGDHLKCRRLTLKLLQREVAEKIGVCKPSITTGKTTAVSRTFSTCRQSSGFSATIPSRPQTNGRTVLSRPGPPWGSHKRTRRGKWAWTRAPWPVGNEVNGSPLELSRRARCASLT
jgi:hypothetical protein